MRISSTVSWAFLRWPMLTHWDPVGSVKGSEYQKEAPVLASLCPIRALCACFAPFLDWRVPESLSSSNAVEVRRFMKRGIANLLTRPRPGRPRGVVLLLAVLLFVSLPILFNVRVRVRWSQWDTQSISLDTEPPVQSDALVMAEIARNDSWRPRTVEAFNAHFEHILDICTSGGPCSKNHDKLVRERRALGWIL